jgi:hypothetical protein
MVMGVVCKMIQGSVACVCAVVLLLLFVIYLTRISSNAHDFMIVLKQTRRTNAARLLSYKTYTKPHATFTEPISPKILCAILFTF